MEFLVSKSAFLVAKRVKTVASGDIMPNMEENQVETQHEDVKRDDNGRWITPPKSPAPITHANARSLAKKRWDKTRRAAAAAVIEEGRKINEGVASMPAVWGLVNVHLFNTIMKSDKPRPQAVELLGKNIGALANEWEKEESQGESRLESDLRGLIAQIAAQLPAIPAQLHATDGDIIESE